LRLKVRRRRDQPAGPLGCGLDLSQVAAKFGVRPGKTRAVARSAKPSMIGEQVVEIVGDASGRRAEALHFWA
jgi:hypothetical protein